MYMNISPPSSERAWLLLSKQQDLSPMAVSGVHGRGDVKNTVNKIRGSGTRELPGEVSHTRDRQQENVELAGVHSSGHGTV